MNSYRSRLSFTWIGMMFLGLVATSAVASESCSLNSGLVGVVRLSYTTPGSKVPTMTEVPLWGDGSGLFVVNTLEIPEALSEATGAELQIFMNGETEGRPAMSIVLPINGPAPVPSPANEPGN